MVVTVRQAIKRAERDGLIVFATRGSHRPYKHSTKPIAGKLSDDVAIGTWVSITKQARLNEDLMRYAIVIEDAGQNFSAYGPDLPGSVATGATVDEVAGRLRDAIRFHIEGLREDGLPIPEPRSLAQYADA